MTPRSARRRGRPAAVAPVVLVALLLAGCTGTFLTDGGGSGTAAPAPTATASPEPTATAEPEPEYDCDDILLNRPGRYLLGECGTVTIEGQGVELVATSIAELVIRGDDNDVMLDVLGDAELFGQDNEIVAAEAGNLILRGDENLVVVEGEIASVNVEGNENEVRAGLGIGAVSDNGLLNQIG